MKIKVSKEEIEEISRRRCESESNNLGAATLKDLPPMESRLNLEIVSKLEPDDINTGLGV